MITTGNINATTLLNNRYINNSDFSAVVIMNGISSVILSGNGADSTNYAYLNDLNNFNIAVINVAEIVNDVDHNLNTGNNTTIGNLGDAVIITGDIDSNITVNNEHINSSHVDITCECDEPSEPETPTTPTTPTTPGTSIVQGSSGSSNGSSGSTPGTSLPRTGSTIPFSFMLTLILLFMFLSGLYLRFNSGKAPPVLA